MDPASCDFKITAFPCKFMIDLVSIRDHSPGESIQEFTADGLSGGKAASQRGRWMSSAQRPVSVDPHVNLLTVFDLCMIDPHDFYR